MADDQFGIPSEIYPSDLGSSGTIDHPVKMDTSGRVNFAIDVIKSLLSVHGWSVEPEYASVTFTIDLPLADQKSAIGSLVMPAFSENYAKIGMVGYQMYDPAIDTDPSGASLSTNYGDGRIISSTLIGIPVTRGMSQYALIGALVAQMNIDLAGTFIAVPSDPIDDPGSPFDGVTRTITVIATHDVAFLYGPYLNDTLWVGNVLGGGSFNGTTKGGGWALTSRAANGYTPLRVSLTNNYTSNLAIQATFMNGPHADVGTNLATTILPHHVMHKRTNYIIIAGPYQLIIYPEDYLPYVADSTTDVDEGIDDYWLCAPFVPDKYRFQSSAIDPTVTGIPYCAFEAISPRTQLNATNVTNCVSDRYISKQFAPLLDCGMSIYVVNTNLHDRRPLTTTTQIGLIVSPIVGLSPGSSLFDREHHVPYVNQPLSIVGYIWDAYTTTYYAPPNAIQVGKDNRNYIAYRQQYEPCECTLWIAF